MPDQPDAFPGVDRKIDPGKRAYRTETLFDPLQPNDVRDGAPPSHSTR